MTDIDEIELAAAAAEAETGARGGGSKLRLCLNSEENKSSRSWSAKEEAYVVANHGRITVEEIAANLGRTVASIDNHIKREMHLTAPSKSPEIVTAEQIAWGLGMGCGKSAHRLIDDGILPGRRLPGPDVNRVVDRQALLRWMIVPEHWIYFKPERVGSLRSHGKRTIGDCYDFEFWEGAREIVLKARAAWKDEWITPGQAAKIIGINPALKAHNINMAIHAGNLRAVRWGNWWILRSDLPASDMTINALGRIVPKIKPKYVCPRGMARHVNISTCMKLRLCQEMATYLKQKESR